MFSHFDVQSLVYFELILVYYVRYLSSFFISFACGCTVFPTPVIENTVLSLFHICGCNLVYSLTIYMWVYFLSLFHSIYPCLCFYDSSILLIWLTFLMLFEIRECHASSCVPSQGCFGYLGCFVVTHKF